MSWYTDYKLIKDGDGYILAIYLNQDSEFAKEFLSNKESPLKLEDKLADLIKEKFSNIKINTVKLIVGAVTVVSIPFYASMASAAGAAPSSTSQTGTVTASSLNVRAGPSTSHSIMHTLWNGNQINVIGESGNWYNIRLSDGRTGWVSKDYIASQMNTTGTVTATRLNVRTGPSTSHNIMHTLWNGNRVNIIGESGNWYNIRLSDGRTGWVSKDYIASQMNKTGTVTATRLNVRTGPSTSHSIMHTLWNGNRVNVIDESDGWYKIRLSDGRTGWVSKTYLQITETNQQDTKQQKIDKVIATAKSLIGTPYVYGGESLQEGGFDCSGFTQYVYKQVGVSLNRISSDQAVQGIYVSRSNIQPGDLVFFSFNANNKVDHVGIYIGDGQMIHSPRTGDTVKTTNINVSYWQQRYVTARRLIY
ncbi:MAG: SH3 domain-containing protein [Oscillospiraceae bacterium]|nr:SH3 domain-containing protein [Oscillospiraceae bacterium]